MRHRSSKPSSKEQDDDTSSSKEKETPPHTRRKRATTCIRLPQEIKDFLSVFTITMCIGYVLILLRRKTADTQTYPVTATRRRRIRWGGRTVFQDADILDPLADLKLATPIIVVGLPKSGTTSISSYFLCGRIASSHFKCEISEDDFHETESSWRNCRIPKGSGGPNSAAGSMPLCSVCVHRNILHNRPPLEGCGPYDVWAELDSAEHPLPSETLLRASTNGEAIVNNGNVQPLCLYPQISHLEEIHEAYPNATFILNLRTAERWVASISKWNPSAPGDEKRKGRPGRLREVLTECDLSGFPSGVGKDDNEMITFYNSHSQRIRDFVRKYPSHTLVEVDIETENAGIVLEEAFGISSKCWKQRNPSVKRAQKSDSTSRKYSKDDVEEKGPQLSPEVMDGIEKEKPATQLLFEYPYCKNAENIFPSRRKLWSF